VCVLLDPAYLNVCCAAYLRVRALSTSVCVRYLPPCGLLTVAYLRVCYPVYFYVRALPYLRVCTLPTHLYVYALLSSTSVRVRCLTRPASVRTAWTSCVLCIAKEGTSVTFRGKAIEKPPFIV